MPITSPSTLAMASSNLIAVSVGLLSTIFVTLVSFATWIWWHSNNLLDGNDHVEEQETAHREQVAEVLANILASTMHEQDARTDGGYDPVDLEEQFREIILAADLDSLNVALLEFGTPEKLHKAAVKEYERAYKRIALAALGYVSIPVVIVAVAVSGGDPFTWAWDIAHASLGIISSFVLLTGFVAFFRARDIERELKGR